MRILLAVSGGIDSMYLAERASELFAEASFAIAHCNFSLRGEESDGDEEFVLRWASAHGMRCFVKRFDTHGYAAQKGISIEMAARELRYGWFSELCGSEGFDAVAVAHHSDDNAETFFLNLLRGTGLKGLRGMSGTPQTLRPLLGLGRKDIEEWMKANGKQWREDSTNGESIYKRNILRNEVFPLFERINPSFRKTLRSDMAHLDEAYGIVEDYYRSCGLEADRIDISGLMGFKHWRYLLYRLTEGRLNASQLERLGQSLESGGLPSGRTFGPYVTTSSAIVLRTAPAQNPEYEIEVFDRPEGFQTIQKAGILVFDADLFKGRPVLRGWRNGDWMVPLGMKGRKKISDLFVDLKWSIADKDRATVVEHPDGGGRVAALLPVRSDESLKITDGTKRILRIAPSVKNHK